MRKMMIGAAVIALSAALGAGLAGAATAAPSAAKPKPSAQDISWMRSNVQGDLADIAIGKLALTKSKNANLVTLAKDTVKDHEAMLAAVQGVASAYHVKLPAAPDTAQRKQAKQLKSLSGIKFALAWDNAEIAGHKVSIAQTETEIRKGSSKAGIVGLAKAYLPVATQHLAMAQKLHSELTKAN
jgi:putative membrane protein